MRVALQVSCVLLWLPSQARADTTLSRDKAEAIAAAAREMAAATPEDSDGAAPSRKLGPSETEPVAPAVHPGAAGVVINGVFWHTDYQQAVAAAGDKPLLLHFSSANCVPCRRLEQLQGYAGTALILKRNYVCCRIDTDQNAAFARLMGVTAIPTEIVRYRGQERFRWRGLSPSDTPGGYATKLTTAASRLRSTVPQ